MKDYYMVLKVNHFASENEIKRAYRVLAKRWHPDRNPGDRNSAEMFKMINEAYSVLSNPVLKARYDDRLRNYILNLNVDEAKVQTAKPHRERNESYKKTLFNRMRTFVEELVFEEEHQNNTGYLKGKFLNLSKTRKFRKLRSKLMDLIYEDRD